MTVYTAVSLGQASKVQAEVQTYRSENLLSHLHLSYHTWSGWKKLPDTDQFVSSEAFMKKVKTCSMMAELAFVTG